MSWASRPLALVSMLWALGVLAPPELRAKDPPEAGEESEGRQQARALALEGIERFEKERWAEAHERLGRAFELYPAPTVALLDGKALEKLGRLVEAEAMFRRAAEMPVDDESPKPFLRAVREAERERARVAALVPSLTIEVRGATPAHTVTVNGVAVPSEAWGQPQAFDPGSYTVVAKRGASVERSEQLTLAPKSQVSLILTLPASGAPRTSPPPAPTGPAEPRSATLTWTALGIGAAGVATGIVAGLVMQNARSSLDAECTPGCPESSRATLSRFRTARTVSTVGYSAGAVGLGIGLWLLLDDAAADEAPVAAGVSYRKGSAELALSGAF